MRRARRRLLPLTGPDRDQSQTIANTARMAEAPSRGRPWQLPLAEPLELAAAALRTNLTNRQLAAVLAISN